MPSANKTPNLNLNKWQGNENAKRQDFVSDNENLDAAIGDMTIDDALVPSGNTGLSIKILLSWLGNMIKAITGKSSWRTAPAKTMQQLADDQASHTADNTAHGVANKVDKVAGKGLSSNDYTTAEKNKLAGIAAGANAYVHPGSGTNPHGTTKSDVGLGNVDNAKQLPIAGGTMTGKLIAQNNTDYTTKQVRNIILSTADPSGTPDNGDIWIKYKA